MSKQTLNNGDTMGVIRGKINDNFTEVYGAAAVIKTANFDIDASLNGKTVSNYGATTDIKGTFAAGLSDGFGVRVVNEGENAPGLDANVMMYLKMQGLNLGTTFTDSSTNNLSVTSSGAVTKTDVFKFGTSSGYFDGSNDYLSLPDFAGFKVGTGDFTIDTWIYLITGIASDTQLIAWAGTVNAPNFGFESGGRPYIYAGGYYARSGVNLTMDAWSHVAFVRSSGVIQCYINGVARGSADAYTGNITTAPSYIGRYSGGQYIKAYMSGFRFSNNARWTAGFEPLLGFYGTTYPVILVPPSGGRLPLTSAVDRNLVSALKGDSIEISKTANNFIGKSVFPAAANWVDTPQA